MTTPTPQSLLDYLPLPRLTFSWPALELISSTPTAEGWLPLARNIKLFNPRACEPKLALSFDLIFANNDAAAATAQDWVLSLLARSAAAPFGQAVVLNARHYRHPTAASVFLAPAPAAGGGDVLEVVLLNPVVDSSAPGTPAKVGDPSEFVSAPLAEVAGKGMSLEETDALLLQFSKGTLDKSNGPKVLTDEEVRLVVDDLPEIAFTANNNGEITWFNRRWYEFVSCDQGLVSTSTNEADQLRATDRLESRGQL